MTKGTVAEIRDRMLRVLKGCGVDMLIIDEADRFAEILWFFRQLKWHQITQSDAITNY